MSGKTRSLEPILCAHLLRKVDERLIDLLRSLRPGEWEVQTIVPSWKVRDVAAHLLDTAFRKLSAVRDGSSVEAVEIRSPQDLAVLVNRLNREGVTVYRRLSRNLLIDCMDSRAIERDPTPRSVWTGDVQRQLGGRTEVSELV